MRSSSSGVVAPVRGLVVRGFGVVGTRILRIVANDEQARPWPRGPGVADGRVILSSRGRGVLLLCAFLLPALVLWSVFAVMAVIGWCGISGCGGGGFGETSEFRVLSIGLMVVGGVVMALPFMLAPWTESTLARRVTGVAVGLGMTLLFVLAR